jgi:hypothetical protein
MIGRIYKLEGGGKFYIGSTICELKYRLKKHRCKSNETNSKNRLVYIHFKEIGWDNCKIILLKEVEVKDRNELLNYEKEEILNVINDNNCLNSILPIITDAEKKKRDAEYSKKRRQSNPERERERLQKWRKANPEKYKQQYLRFNSKKNVR